MSYDLVAFIALGVLALLLVPAVIRRPVRLAPWVVVTAAALRVFGSMARLEVNQRFYRSGDALAYYDHGLELARRLWDFDLSALGLEQWFSSAHWWGTPFMRNVSGLTLAFVGPSIRAEFLVFSLLSLAGLYFIAVAFHRALSERAAIRFAAWIFLWPSLWYWPSSVGKEAVTLLAVGIATLGFVGRYGKPRWIVFLSGLALAFAIRPHVAVVVAMAALVAQWLGTWKVFSPRRALETALMVFVFLFAIRGMMGSFAADERFELEESTQVDEFVEFWRGQTMQGGSAIGSVPKGLIGAPLAFVNVWMRPFPWEVHNLPAAFAAFELVLLWWLVWKNRERVLLTLRHWRDNRLVRFGLPLLVAYTLMIGLTFGNLGIIARQRVPAIPFFLLLLTCVPLPTGPEPEESPGQS